MKICLLHPSKNAYSETFIHAHIERLPAEMEVLYGRPPQFRIEDDRNIQPFWIRGAGLFARRVLHQNEISSRLSRMTLRRFLKRHNVDVVLAEYGPTGISAMDVCLEANIPLVVHFHGYDAYDKSTLKQFGSAYKRLFVAADAVIAVSRDMEQQLLSLGAPHEKLLYNPYGVDTSLFSEANPALAQPIFVAVGRFVDKKAPHLTLLAFKKVVETCPEARLIMIGEGVLWEACKQLTSALGIAHTVEFLGSRSHAEVSDTMQKARAFVQHSITTNYGDSEGTPLAVLEAGATGLPVVGTYHAGIKDVVIHKKTGFLVDEGDINSMVKYMIRLAKDTSLAATLGRRAREHICSNFSMEKSIRQLSTIIESTLYH